MPPAEPTPNRRPWFQLHLSTCVVLMFVAGALVWANARSCLTVEYGYDWSGGTTAFRVYRIGWPVTLEQQYDQQLGAFLLEPRSYIVPAIDIGVALMVLFGSVLLCEWLARRRERQP
jgi:hypothetical protein